MVYAGQEVGEPAKGAQGFSSDDGRTSIFDYCNVPNLQLWTNQGKFDGKLLNKEQKILRNHYVKLLNLCIENDTIRNGGFYDLQYLNHENPAYDTNRVYSFFRYTANEKLLIICNFDRYHEHHIRIGLSEQAAWHIGLDPHKEWVGTDIFTSNKGFVVSGNDAIAHGIPTNIGPKEALIFRVRQ